LFKYLQKEASSHNKFGESKTNPKADLQRLEAMISKQESKEEPLDQKNDKLLHKQLKELMEDKQHSEKALNNLKAHNGDSKDKVAKNGEPTSATEVEVFDDSIFKYIQRSKHFQDFLKDKGVIAGKSAARRLDVVESGGEENRPLSEQFEEIELQKEILNLKEKQLRNRDKNKLMAKKKESIRVKENEQAKANHKLHLTNPDREKVSAENENEFKELKHFAEEYRKLRDRKLAENELRNKGDRVLNSRSENTNKKHQENSNKKETSPSKPKENEENQSQKVLDDDTETPGEGESSGDGENKEIENGSAKESTNENTDDLSSASNSDTQSKEMGEKTTSAEEAENRTEDKQLVDEYTDNNGFSKSTTIKPVDDVSTDVSKPKIPRNISLTADRHEMLKLPINNPKPEADTTLTPHADFHTTSHVIRPHSAAALRHLSPISANQTVTVERRRLSDLIVRQSAGTTKSAALFLGKNKLHTVPSHRSFHHAFPILEPPMMHEQSRAGESMQKAFIHPNTIVQPLPATSQPGNLLKHRDIPLPMKADKKHITMFVHAVGSNHVNHVLSRFIRPNSIPFVNVHAVKKGFGKLPSKPKDFLLRELQKDIALLDRKQTVLKNNSVSKVAPAATKNATKKFILGPPAVISRRRVLVPSKRSELTPTVNKQEQSSSPVISPKVKRSNVRVEVLTSQS